MGKGNPERTEDEIQFYSKAFRHNDGYVKIPLYAVLRILGASSSTEGTIPVIVTNSGEYRGEPGTCPWGVLSDNGLLSEAEAVWKRSDEHRKREWCALP